MKTISVKLHKRSYEIIIGSGVRERLPHILESLKFSGPIVIITDKGVMSRAGFLIAPVLKKLSNSHFSIVVDDTEKSKSLRGFQNVIQKISEKTKTHLPLIVAFGGGVVGDLAGFAAATYRRGVPFIQIPTTLLAQVDSSIGGKVGIDLAHAKNIVGAFYQPKAVLIDPDFLKTLPKRQIQSGTAEIIKYAIISNQNLFRFLENNIQDILSLRKKTVERVISECVDIKTKIVEKDEFDDKDVRIALNFGHTLAHAIESAMGYSANCGHGEAVAIGMVLAGEISKRLDMLGEKDFDRIKALIKKAGFTVKFGRELFKKIIDSYGYDKKFISGANRFVLPKKIGSVEVIEDIPGILIRTVLREYSK